MCRSIRIPIFALLISAAPVLADPPRVVKATPDHDYQLSINSDMFINFRSARGEPAVPYPISFRTAGQGAAPIDMVEVNRGGNCPAAPGD